MLFQVLCPGCKSKINIKDERFVGKKVPCPKCKQPLLIKRPIDEVVEVHSIDDGTSSGVVPPPHENIFDQDFGSLLPTATDFDAIKGLPSNTPHSVTNTDGASADYWKSLVTPLASTPAAVRSPSTSPTVSNRNKLFLIGSIAASVTALFLCIVFAGIYTFIGTGGADNSGRAQSNTFANLENEWDSIAANMEKVAKGWARCEDTFKRLPNVNGIGRFDRETNQMNEPMLSWRVELLPFVGEQALFEKFNFKEPWDSPDNLALLEQMPDVFKTPGVTKAGFTSMHVLTGETTLFHEKRTVKSSNVSDGSSVTLLFVAAGSDTAVEWTKPEGIPFTSDSGIEILGQPRFDKGFWVSSFSFNLHVIPKDMDKANFQAFVTPTGAEKQVNLSAFVTKKDVVSHEEAYGSLFEKGPDPAASKNPLYFGYKTKHRKAFEAFLRSNAVKKRIPEMDESMVMMATEGFESSLRNTAGELEIKPDKDGNYFFPLGPPGEPTQIIEILREEKEALKKKPFKEPFDITLSVLTQLMVDAHDAGTASEELDYCLFLALSMSAAKMERR